MTDQKRVECLRCQPGGSLNAEHAPSCKFFLVHVKEELASVKILVADIERHLNAGGIAKVACGVADLEHAVRNLHKKAYTLAFPNKCGHWGSKTDVQGGGQSCNNCGDFC